MIEIKKAEIKNNYTLAYNYTQQEDNFENKISTKSDAPIHNDLRNEFTKLTPHLAYICEEINKEKATELINILQSEWSIDESSKNYSEPLKEFLSKYQVDGFEINGKGDKESVKILGSKLLDTLKAISLTSPNQEYDDYPFSSELAETVENCRTEVYEYFKGKQAPSSQTEMDFEFEEQEEEE